MARFGGRSCYCTCINKRLSKTLPEECFMLSPSKLFKTLLSPEIKKKSEVKQTYHVEKLIGSYNGAVAFTVKDFNCFAN